MGKLQANGLGGDDRLRSLSKAGLTCYSDTLGDSGQLKCSDGASAAFRFQHLT